MSVKGTAWGLATAACVGVWLLEAGLRPLTPPAPPAAEARAGGAGARADTVRARAAAGASTALAPSPPTRFRIPRIGVDAPVTGLGLTADGQLAAPPATDSNLAGWYAAGTAPGSRGTAVVAGHVDTARGPAVFYSLGTLRKGDDVEVSRKDGTTALFTVDEVAVYENTAFPDDRVYAAARRPELRVITCGGGYTPGSGYQGNVVAYAHLTGVRL